jgi:hypothetical protein
MQKTEAHNRKSTSFFSLSLTQPLSSGFWNSSFGSRYFSAAPSPGLPRSHSPHPVLVLPAPVPNARSRQASAKRAHTFATRRSDWPAASASASPAVGCSLRNSAGLLQFVMEAVYVL